MVGGGASAWLTKTLVSLLIGFAVEGGGANEFHGSDTFFRELWLARWWHRYDR